MLMFTFLTTLHTHEQSIFRRRESAGSVQLNRVLEKYAHVGVQSRFSHLRFGVAHEPKLVAHVYDADLHFQICQTHADTPMRPVAERQKRVRLDLLLVFGQEAAITTGLDSCTLPI